MKFSISPANMNFGSRYFLWKTWRNHQIPWHLTSVPPSTQKSSPSTLNMLRGSRTSIKSHRSSTSGRSFIVRARQSFLRSNGRRGADVPTLRGLTGADFEGEARVTRGNRSRFFACFADKNTEPVSSHWYQIAIGIFTIWIVMFRLTYCIQSSSKRTITISYEYVWLIRTLSFPFCFDRLPHQLNNTHSEQKALRIGQRHQSFCLRERYFASAQVRCDSASQKDHSS